VISQPRRGDRRDIGLSPLRGWEICLRLDTGGFSTG